MSTVMSLRQKWKLQRADDVTAENLLIDEERGACSHSTPTQNYLALSCDEFNASYIAAFPLTDTWHTVVLSRGDFHEPDWTKRTFVGFNRCLSVVSALIINVQSQLSDGECHSGAFRVDGISFR